MEATSSPHDGHGEKHGSLPPVEKSTDTVEIHTANGPDGQPLIVLSIFGRVGPLALKDAMDIGQALIAAVAASKIVEVEKQTEGA